MLHGHPALLRTWRLRTGRRLLILLLVDLFQRVEDAARGRRRDRRRAGRLRLRGWLTSDDGGRLAVVACEPGQKKAGEEKSHRQNRGRSGQEIGGTAARHEASAAPHA